MKRRVLHAVVLAALCAALVPPAASLAQPPSGVTVYVDDDGTSGAASCDGALPAPTSLQGAIDSVGPDSTILVCPGTYPGPIDIDGDHLDGLTIAGVSRWTATIRATPELTDLDNLVEVFDVDRLTIRHLRFLVPASTSPCTQVGDIIDVDEARKLRILANRFIAKGADTRDCGYGRAIKLQDVRATIAWNLIRNSVGAAIEVCASHGPTRIYRNSIRVFHSAAEGPGFVGDGIDVACNVGSGPYRIIDNVIRALPTAGDTTPRMLHGIDARCCTAEISGNVISGARWGIDVDEDELDTIIEDNTVTAGYTVDGAGIKVRGDRQLTIRDNTVNGYAKGVSITGGSGHSVLDNDLVGNTVSDCDDETSGSGTGGTANTWSGNLASTSNPAGICPTAS